MSERGAIQSAPGRAGRAEPGRAGFVGGANVGAAVLTLNGRAEDRRTETDRDRGPAFRPAGNAHEEHRSIHSVVDSAASAAIAAAQSDVPGVNPSPGIPSSQMPSVLSKVSLRPAAQRAAAARPAVQGRRRPRRCGSAITSAAAGGAGVRVLRVPDALHAGAERADDVADGARPRRSGASSTSWRSASIRARRRCWRAARRRRTSIATSGRGRTPAGTS